MKIRQSRKLNEVTDNRSIVIKKILESKQAFLNEKYALGLLKLHTPKLIRAHGQIIETKKIIGQHLSEIEINHDIIEKLASVLNYIHSHKLNGLSFIHGDLHKDNIFLSNKELVLIDFSCAIYDDPLIDAAAVEIHITNDNLLLNTFYKTLKVDYDREKINEYKIMHCLKHLEWADKEGFYELANKSRQIIKEVKDEKK